MVGRLLAGIACVCLFASLSAAGATAQSTAVSEPIHFGFNDEWGHHADKLSLVQGTGADTTRAVLSWRVVEKTPGEYDWSAYDRLAEQFRAVGTRPLWVLADAPCWAWTSSETRCAIKGGEPRPPKRSRYDEWALFAAHVAYRYPDAVAIESWNEANLDNFFRPRPDPVKAAWLAYWANAGVDYAATLTGSDIPVLFGGSAPLYETIPEKREIAYDEFLRAAYDEIPGGAWDGVAMHPFPRFKAREDYLQDIEEHLDAVRAALFDSRASGTPIWVTEVGLSTAGPFPYSQEDQAEGLRTIYRALDAMPDVTSVIVHRLIDGPKSLKTAESGWGVVQRNLTPKPALCALTVARRGGTCG
jgi:polysaccharide biosynthesis protein PslG